jgi:hypothetical protein
MQNARVVEGSPDSVSDTSSFFGTVWWAVIPFRQVSVVRVPGAFAKPLLRCQIRPSCGAFRKIPLSGLRMIKSSEMSSFVWN